MCYVEPTKDMYIKPKHPHVDSNGLVYSPYLNKWNERSTLSEFVVFMISAFESDPPVLSKVAQPFEAYPYQHQQQQHSPQQQQHSPQQQQFQQQPSSWTSYPGQPQQNYAKPYAQPYQPPVTPSPQHQHQHQSQPQQPQPSPHQSQDQKKAELIKQVTHRMQEKIRKDRRERDGEISTLLDQQAALNLSSQKIASTLNDMKKEKADLEGTLERLNSRSEEAEKWLSENQADKKIDIDSIIYYGDSWSQQLFELSAKDHALEDTMDILSRILHTGASNLDVQAYLKQIRLLAHEQFFVRALAIKINLKQKEQQRGMRFNSNFGMSQQQGAMMQGPNNNNMSNQFNSNNNNNQYIPNNGLWR